MLGGAFSAVFVVLVAIWGQLPPYEMGPFLFFASLFPLLLLISSHSFVCVAFSFVQRREEQIPRIISLFKQDIRLKKLSWGIYTFLSLLFVLHFSAPFFPFSLFWLVGTLLVAYGVVFDLIRLFASRILSYLDPFIALTLFSQIGKEKGVSLREETLCERVESLSEIAAKSLAEKRFSFCNAALAEVVTLIEFSLEMGKMDKTSPIAPLFTKEEAVKGKYLLLYTLNRIDALYIQALHDQSVTVCETLISILGKIAIAEASVDLSLTAFSVSLLGKCSQEAEKQGISDLSLKGSCLLSALFKTLLQNVSPSEPHFADPFLSILHQLDAIQKEIFKKNKETEIQLLVFPFQELKATFLVSKLESIPEGARIIQEIDRILAEWQALETVMRSLPKMQKQSV